ncbi:hypothetical protein M3T53_07235 [Actinomyces sp. B33]|uniref:hypothetical protein n=1 Tax=Actinomyces sp. B33 TaxID=2942131 RepID=UPI0023404AD3|nr:hypothetical protein [Actinomyces sp. B33]MDC4233498.1 hypothetical protein [Actinomyces sp. B33]
MIDLTLTVYGSTSSSIVNPSFRLPEIGLMEFERIAKASGRYATDPSEAGNTSLAFYPFDIDLHLDPTEDEGKEPRELLTAQFDVWPEYPPFSVPFHPIIEFTKRTLDLFVSTEISGVSVEIEIPSPRASESRLITGHAREQDEQHSHSDPEYDTKRPIEAVTISIEHCTRITFRNDVFAEEFKKRLGRDEGLDKTDAKILSPSNGTEVEYPRNSYLRHTCTEGIQRHSFAYRTPRPTLADISRIIDAAFLAYQEAADHERNDQEGTARARFTIGFPRRPGEDSDSPQTRHARSNSDRSPR